MGEPAVFPLKTPLLKEGISSSFLPVVPGEPLFLLARSGRKSSFFNERPAGHPSIITPAESP